MHFTFFRFRVFFLVNVLPSFLECSRSTWPRRANCITIDDFDGQVIKQLVRYIYTGAIDESLETSAQDLLLIADKYDIDGLKIYAQLQLQNGLSIDTVYGVLATALIVPGAEALRDKCCRFIIQNNKAVKEHPNWQSLSDGAKAFYANFVR